MKAKRRLLIPLLVLLLMVVAAALLPMRVVRGQEMAWSVQEGDLVWVLPDRVRKGDVVVITDPLDPSRKVLRRAVANGGQKVLLDEQGVRVNGKRIRQEEMGEHERFRVLKEVIWSSPPARANAYLPMIVDQPTGWKSAGPVEVPEGSWYLLADNRDEALDSRWWGPISEDRIHGVVRFRVGSPDTWRRRWQLMLPEE